ncbi:diacylglycerol kinase (ATP) [Powellomyces hirtus]|uniref:diacylglycerol kinase (ATP) n=1 Tax=Powellomyces hirtus TaxID=109895 RepID=A0A507DUF9_9FUNG|nr:diacylglycerol kinase (ATP) [Powellomyces hirtus]
MAVVAQSPVVPPALSSPKDSPSPTISASPSTDTKVDDGSIQRKPTGEKSSASDNIPSQQQTYHDQDLLQLLNMPPVAIGDGSSIHAARDDDLNPKTSHTRHEDDLALPAASPTDTVKVQGRSGNAQDTVNDGAATVEATQEEGESLVVVPTHYVFIFSNPRSGNQQGLPLVQMNIQHYRMRDHPHVQVQLYDFLDESDRSAGLKYLNLLLSKQKTLKELHVWSAGGDGTLMGVVEGMIEMGIDVADDPRVLFSVIPFGTGNDLSQVLGWGRYVSGTDVAGRHLEGLNKLVTDRLNGHKTLLDIWGVELETEEGGWVREAGKEKISTLRRKMSNYSSVGLQGRVGVGFEENRRGSRVMNAVEYSKQSLGVLIHGAPAITDAVKGLEAGGEYFDLDGDKSLRVTHEPIEMIIQNIPGMWGRHVDLWGVAEMSRSIVREQKGPTDLTQWTPHCAYDGKLEVFGIGSLRSYLRKQFSFGRKRLQRVGQMPSPFTIHFHPNSKIHAMIDGEFYETCGAKKMTYTRIMQIKLIGGHPDSSRLVSDLQNKVAEQPGPTGEGLIPGVDFPVGKTEYAEETKNDRVERRQSQEMISARSRGSSAKSHKSASKQHSPATSSTPLPATSNTTTPAPATAPTPAR